MTQAQIMAQALAEVENELIVAIKRHGMPVDYHHGIGILGEEVHELFLEVFRKDQQQNPLKIAAEAKQVAAVAIKIVVLAMSREEAGR